MTLNLPVTYAKTIPLAGAYSARPSLSQAKNPRRPNDPAMATQLNLDMASLFTSGIM